MSNEQRKPTVPDVLPLARAYYEIAGNEVGGHLHIVLEDYNIDDGSVQFCLDEARAHRDEAGVELASLLLRMSKTQRLKIARTR
jgi:hypothetical protein